MKLPRRSAWLAAPSLRALGLTWSAALALAAVGAGALAVLGPPRPAEPSRHAEAAAPDEHHPAPHAPDAAHASSGGHAAPAAHGPDDHAAQAPPPPARPGRSEGSGIAAPDRALSEAATDVQGGGALPRIAPDGRAPMAVYARPFAPPPAGTPLVGLVIAGAGLNAGDTEDAARLLPGGVTFALSPYAAGLAKVQDALRAGGHEMLLSIPMEPQGYPANDPGPQALLTGANDARNLRALNWALTRAEGYVGVTGALGTMRGERFAASAVQMAPVLDVLAARGLLYLEPRPGAAPPPGVWARGVDSVIDEPTTRRDIDTKLAALEQLARERGSAIGLIGAVRPVTIDRIGAWSGGLAARGVALAPVSALAQPPRTEKDAAR